MAEPGHKTVYWPFRLFDQVKRSKVNNYYRFFLSTLTWSEKEVRSFQLARLKEILGVAYKGSSFYRRRFEENNFTPDTMREVEELQRIPPLTRSDLQQYLEDIICEKEGRRYLASSSSGTTGIPVTYIQDVDGYSAGMAGGFLLWSMAGWKPGHKGIHIWGNPESVKKWNTVGSRIKQFLFNQKNYPAYHLNFESRLPELIKIYRKYRPVYIDGYSQSIYTLARFLEDKNLSLPKCRFILGTAENLFPHQKDTIEKCLGRFSDLYGFGEINGIAIKTAGSNKFTVLDSRVYMETIPGPRPDMHEIVVTDLFNRVLPFIRYRPGDFFTGPEGNSESYPQFSAFRNLEGRTANIIQLPGGKVVQPVNLLGGTFFRNQMSLRKHKVIWDGTSLHIIFEIRGEYHETKIKEALEEYLQPYGVPLKFSFTTNIPPGPSGKYDYFENLTNSSSSGLV